MFLEVAASVITIFSRFTEHFLSNIEPESLEDISEFEGLRLTLTPYKEKSVKLILQSHAVNQILLLLSLHDYDVIALSFHK